MMTARVRSIRNDFDWSSLRYPGERVIRAEIQSDVSLSQKLLEIAAEGPPLFRKSVAGGLRVGANIAPGLFRALEILRQIVQPACRIELEVVPSGGWQWAVATSSDGRMKTIRVGAEAINSATLREFLFQAGRKLGQSILDAQSLPFDPSSRLPDSSRGALLARGWWRFQEMTADRFGLLCCQETQTAIECLIRRASGLSREHLHFDLAQWLEDRCPEEEAMISPREDDFLRLRCAALLKFADSPRYENGLDRGFVELDASWPARSRVTRPSPAMEAGQSLAPALPVSRSRQSMEQGSADTQSSAGPMVGHGDGSPVVYRMVGNDPSVVEAVFAESSFDVPTVAPAAVDERTRAWESELCRSFGSHGAFWLLSQTEEVTARQRAMVADLYGETVFDELRPRFEKLGEQIFPDFCRSKQNDLARLDSATRYDLLRELVRLAMTDHRDPSVYQQVFAEITVLLSLSKDDLSQALADFVDPEFAHYGFGPGEVVEVRLDGQWVSGIVESVDQASGEVRVRFSSTGKSLRLHPLADVIRPRLARTAS